MIEIPGIFLPAVTIEDMKQAVTKIPNLVITRVFRELKFIEQWGSGMRRIFIQAREQKRLTPQIVKIGMRVRFIVPLKNHPPPKISSRPKAVPSSENELLKYLIKNVLKQSGLNFHACNSRK